MAKKGSLRDRMLGAAKSEFAGYFDDEDYGKIRDWIDTGSIVLNCLISADPDRGMPTGRIIQWAGPQSVGKTFVCMETVKQAQAKGYFIVYYDSEAANDKDSVLKRGLDPASLLYVPVATAEELTTSMLNIIDEADADEKVMIVVDSIGNLSTRKELQDSTDGSEKKDMTRAAKLKALFRTVTIKAGMKNIPVAAVNHVYASVGSFFPSNTVGGGSGSLYASSAIIELSKAQDKKGTDVVGAIITAKNIKSRFAKEKMKVKFNINFNKGLQRYSGLLEIAEVMNVLIPVKRSYAFNPSGEIPKDCQGASKEAKANYDRWITTMPLFSAGMLDPTDPIVWDKILEDGFADKLRDIFGYQSATQCLGLMEDESEE